MLKSKLIIEIDASKWLSVLDFLKCYKPPGYKNFGLQWRRIKSPSAKSRRVFKFRIYLSTNKVLKVTLAQWLLFYQCIWFIYNGRDSPESLQAYNPTLGGYIIQIEIISNMQVPCHRQHAPWHLGANAKSFFGSLYWRSDSSHCNEPALGDYFSLSISLGDK